MTIKSDPLGEMPKLDRRGFLGAMSLLAAAKGLASPAPAEPLLDIHQHTNYQARTDQELVAHQAYHEVTTTVLLPGAGWLLSVVGDNASCARLQADFPDVFVRFACSDVAESRTVDVLRGNIQRGAIGFGELKFHVAVDSPEMHRVYKLAEELQVPVLLHFEHEMYNTGFERFESVLKAYPKVTFVGHAQTWWGNISADLDPTVMYATGKVKPGGLTDRLLSDYANLYGDLSANSGANAMTRDPDFAQDFLERHYRKLLWGSDCPCRDGKGEGQPGGCIAGRCLAALRKLVTDRAKLRRILYENGAALYHLRKV
jgi:predicted TIM-barrel fold metal-dependent hydrolase